jgi:alkanesulfonate monooxygenase SsuD/methylene tetrahydromethanopterin reductase-like flavin-dependent oxidoreductase (luciferase family)
LADLAGQARLAVKGGFDGITLAEHHAGLSGYVPNPAQVAGWLLGEIAVGWAAACPILLPLRSAGLVAEEIAWLAARHPGRVGVGFAPGFAVADFAIAGTAVEDRRLRFAAALPSVVAALQGQAVGPLAADPAIALTRNLPVPAAAIVDGPIGARRAATAGAGAIFGAFTAAAPVRSLLEVYEAAGGRGPRLLIRRAWLGTMPEGALEQMLAAARRLGAGGSSERAGDDVLVVDTDSGALAERLAAVLRESGADALNLRFVAPGAGGAEVEDQIARFGSEVLPRLRGLIEGVS